MDEWKVMRERHSARSHDGRPLTGEDARKIRDFLGECNSGGGLSMKLVTGEPKAFSSRLARYGAFSGVVNYIVVAGPKTKDLDERCGHYGEKAVLFAQSLGLSTCWAALTYSKGMAKGILSDGGKLRLAIAIGYGTNPGKSHGSKKREEVMKAEGEAPEWFLRGIDAALLAPTAMNQQKFTFILGEGGLLFENRPRNREAPLRTRGGEGELLVEGGMTREVERIGRSPAASAKILQALLSGNCFGQGASELASKVNLSRPSVSRHLGILMEAGVVKKRREGTSVFYYLDPSYEDPETPERLFSDVRKAVGAAPWRGGDGWG